MLNFYSPHEKISWGFAPTYFFMGKIKVEHPTYLFAAKIKVVKTFMASNLLFILENKSWGYKSNPKQIPKSCGPRQSQGLPKASQIPLSQLDNSKTLKLQSWATSGRIRLASSKMID